MILVDADDVAMSRPGKTLFDGLSVTVTSGDRLGVVGVNGSGKSTLLGVLAGTVRPEAGAVRRGRGARVSFLDQSAPLPEGTVREVVSRMRDPAAGDHPGPGTPAGVAGAGALIDHSAAAILDRLGMSHLLDADVASLSGGEAKRVALAMSLVAVDARDATESDLLILDEPTNHLDIDAITWLEGWLARFRGGLVVVTHDRHVLDRLTTRMLELEAGRAYLHDGGYASYLDARAERREREQAAEEVRRNLARSELAWLRRGARARTRKPKADVATALKIVNGRPEEPERPGELPLHVLTQTPRLGNTVVELRGVSDGYGDDPLFHDVDLVLDKRARLGIVGPNGSGKSTLLDVVAGRRGPRQGDVVHGRTVRLGYYDQQGMELPLDTRVREVVAGPTRQPDWSDAALLERFWFATDAQWAPVRLLSGGERRRLHLVLTLRQAPNVLLLDEPTNDLDLDTLRALEELLDDWAGALVVVSHDRAFLERTVDEVMVMDGHGHAARVPGGYAAYEAQRRQRDDRQRSGSGSGSGTGPDRRRGSGGRASGGGGGRSSRATAAPGARAAAETQPRSRGRTASTLRHRLRQAQTVMNRLQGRQSELEDEMAAAGTEPDELARIGEELARVQSELATAEEEWLELAEEAESVGLRV